MSGITVGSNFGLESLDSLKANRPVQQQQTQESNGDSLQSLDSLMMPRETTTRGKIPTNEDILAPIDAMSPELNKPQKADTGDKNPLDFGVGVVKGFVKAGGDTVMGVVTLAKGVGTVGFGLLTKPKETLRPVKNAMSYAIHNPGKALKTVAVDLPMGIVKGIVNPYAEAIGKGNYGEATGRAVFDVGLILMTAGMNKEGGKVTPAPVTEVVTDTGKTVTEVTNGKKVVDGVTKGAKAVSGAGGSGKVLVNSIEGGVKITKGALKEIKDVVKVSGNGKINGNVIINIGGVVNTGQTTVNAATTASRVAKTSKAAKVAQEVATAGAGVETVAEAAQVASKGAGLISIGFGEIKGAVSRGFAKITGGVGSMSPGFNNGLEAILGTKGANVVRAVGGTIGKGVSISLNATKNTVAFVKANPVTSTLVAGKATDIIKQGLKQSDYYDPVPEDNVNDPLPNLQ